MLKCTICGAEREIQSSMDLHMTIHKDEAKRDPAGVRYDILEPQFLEMMAKIGDYGAKHYGDYNWQKSRLTGGNSPINHIYKHLTSYRNSEQYDHNEIGTDRRIHLAAIAFNAMMEFWYESHQ